MAAAEAGPQLNDTSTHTMATISESPDERETVKGTLPSASSSSSYIADPIHLDEPSGRIGRPISVSVEGATRRVRRGLGPAQSLLFVSLLERQRSD
jgi:hypothetical protein